jgi:hypothetical protein
MIEFPLRLLDPDWYHFREKIGEQKRGPALTDEHGRYHLTLMHRGENFLYTDKNGSTYVSVGILDPCSVAVSSMKKWNYLWKITDAERFVISIRLRRYFEEKGQACNLV